MTELFLKLVSMSAAAGCLVLAVVVLRLLLKRAPRWILCLLWGMVAVRLICPFSLESAWSLIPDPETVTRAAVDSSLPEIEFQTLFDIGHNRLHEEQNVPIRLVSSISAAQVMSAVWLAGILILMIYTGVSYLRLRRRIRTAVRLRDNIYQSEGVPSPFVLGLFRPRIYLPFGMDERSMAHVVAHEQAHIRRRDHWSKPFGFLLLTVYWFHPLMWVAYAMLCRDIELAADERAIRPLDAGQRAAYSEALLACSAPHRRIAACPVAFGEIGVKKRVKHILKYRKPTLWMVGLAVLCCAIAAVCFLTNPKRQTALDWARTLTAEQVESISLVVMPQSPELQYRLFTGDEMVPVIALINDSRGRRLTTHEAVAGGGSFFYVRTTDGVTHEVGNVGNIYLVIDGTYYDAGYRWLSEWDQSYGAGNAPLPEDFFLPETASAAAPSAPELPKLTLAEVLRLSEKGEDLSWEDFDRYAHIETGSGLYIRVYEIDPVFSVWIGGGHVEEKPMYLRLAANAGSDDYIDIRTDDVAGFIEAHAQDMEQNG